MDDGLVRIRERIQQQPSSTRRYAVPLAAAAAALLVLVGGAVLWPRGGGGATPVGSGSPTSTPSVSATDTGSPSPSPSPSSSGTASTGPSVSVPVYYGGTFAGQTMLYREFHRTTSAPVLGALQQMLAAPVDGDYHSLWPAGTKVVNVTRTGDTQTVTLSAPPLPTASVHAGLPLQEVVYTVTAADPTIHRVTIVYPGGQATNVVRGISYETLAQVWLLAPAEGDTVSSPVTISGVAEVFEARVNWAVEKLDGTPVAQGATNATQAAPGRWPWSDTVTLAAGQYVFKAYAISAKDGSVVWTDSKTVTVR
jgi:hypothetical protein